MSLLKLRGRLKAIRGLNSVLSALQVVTVVRMQKVKEKYAAAQHYLQSATEVLRGRIQPVEGKQKVLIIITSNRGLCGIFNYQVISRASRFIKENPDAAVVTLGRRGAEHFRRGREILFSDAQLVERPSFTRAAEVFKRFFRSDREILVAYNSYQSTAVQLPKIYRLYPIPEELESKKEPRDYILEPTADELIEKLFHHYLQARFFQLILDSQMGELAARLMVLKGAVDNSKDLIDNLVISINKARQANITRDLAEIIGSAEALRKTR